MPNFLMGISVWIYAPVLCVIWFLFAYTVKAIVFKRLEAWAGRTPQDWDDFLVSSLKLPVKILILSAGVLLLEKLLPLPQAADRAAFATVKVLVIIALFIFLDRFVCRLLRQSTGFVRGIDLSAGLIPGLIRFVILSFGFLVLLDALGISITPFVASLGVGSLAVALGLQETLANLFAGLYILADQPIRKGDFVRLESGEEGYVTDIGWRNTRIRMLPNIAVIVPNNKIISSIVRNYYLPDKELAVLVEVSAAYSADLEKVERITIDVAQEVQNKVAGAVATFEPFIRFHTYADSSINFTVILRAREFVDQYLLKHEFIKALHVRFQKEGVAFPFPTRTIDFS